MIDPILSNFKQYNSCGYILENQIFLVNEFGTTVLNINEVKSIRLINIRDLRINFFTLTFALITMCFTIFYFEFDIIDKILFLAMLLPIVFFSILFKKLDYKLLLITKNYQFFITKVNESSITHAKDLINNTNSIIHYQGSVLHAC